MTCSDKNHVKFAPDHIAHCLKAENFFASKLTFLSNARDVKFTYNIREKGVNLYEICYCKYNLVFVLVRIIIVPVDMYQ